MPSVDLTPAKLAELKQKAAAAADSPWIADGLEVVRLRPSDFDDETDEVHQIATCECVWNVEHIAAADPATVLAMVEEIERLRGLQCWVIMRKDNRDQVFDGPFFTEEDARLHVPDSLDHEYTVEPWVNQANVIESEAGQ